MQWNVWMWYWNTPPNWIVLNTICILCTSNNMPAGWHFWGAAACPRQPALRPLRPLLMPSSDFDILLMAKNWTLLKPMYLSVTLKAKQSLFKLKHFNALAKPQTFVTYIENQTIPCTHFKIELIHGVAQWWSFLLPVVFARPNGHLVVVVLTCCWAWYVTSLKCTRRGSAL